MSATKLLLVDDQPLIVNALADLLTREAGFDVVGTCSNGEEAVKTFQRLHPDIVMMDIRMPRLDGISAAHHIRNRDCAAKIIFLTSFATVDSLLPCLRVGAAGFVAKDAASDEIVRLVRQVSEGSEHLALSSSIASLLARTLAADAPPAKSDAHRVVHPICDLSPRERQVLQGLSHGFNNQEIANQLHLSHGSIKACVGKICRKLGVRDRLQAVIRGAELGYVTLQLAESDEQPKG